MPQWSEKDHNYMLRALALAGSVKGRTIPNPAVGAVIVKDDVVIGEGATAKCGGPHAEKTAIAQAGKKAAGATLYVTLEPCCHFGRTPPCTDAVLAAGIKKVVVALRDPNPLVAGKGISQLKRHGVEVLSGCMRSEAARLNEDFIFAITNNRAFISLKLAITLDGYVADSAGTSKWITSLPLRRIVHQLRSVHAAVGVGSGTLAADDPMLNVRYGRKADPARIIFTSNEQIPQDSCFCRNAHKARSIAVVRGAGDKRIMVDTASGIEYWFTGENNSAESMRVFAQMAYGENLTSIFVEGGPKIASALLEAGLVNRLYLFYGNRLLGGGLPCVRMGDGLPVDNCITLVNRETIIAAGGDFYITGIPVVPGL